MAKTIKYNLCTRVDRGTEGDPDVAEVLSAVTMGWSEANEAIAKAEAHNGAYTIEDDGLPDPADVPTRLDAVEAQAAYTAMMTDTLLEV